MERLTSQSLALSRFFHRHFLWFLIGAYAVAAVVPAPGLWIRDVTLGDIAIFNTPIHASLLLVLLAALMFNAGLGVKTEHLQALVRKFGVLAAGLAANVLVPIAYISAITTLVLNFWHNPQEAQHILVGLALVAAMPIAGASTAWAQNSNGNLALSLGLVLCSTLLSPLATPMVFYVLGELASDEYEEVLHDLAHYGSAAFLGLWVVLPSLLGLGVRFVVPERRLTVVMPFIKLSNSIILLTLNYSNAAVSLPKAVAEHDLDFLAITLSIATGLCVAAFSAAYWLSCLFRTPEAERVSLMYGLGMNNNGTALVLASLALASFPRIMVPIIFYNIVQHLVAGAVHHMTNREAAQARQAVLRST
jgi:BASS family bile acid:Na+ symporter